MKLEEYHNYGKIHSVVSMKAACWRQASTVTRPAVGTPKDGPYIHTTERSICFHGTCRPSSLEEAYSSFVRQLSESG